MLDVLMSMWLIENYENESRSKFQLIGMVCACYWKLDIPKIGIWYALSTQNLMLVCVGREVFCKVRKLLLP